MRRVWLVALALAYLSLLPRVARAGLIEQFVQLALQPGDPDTLVLRYVNGGNGLVITHDGGATWSLVCNSFVDPTAGTRNGVAAVAGDGAILLGVFQGAWQADAAGCGWALTEGVGARWVADIAQDPSEPDVLYAVTANGGDGVMNGILRREAGDEWSELGPQEELMIFRMQVVSTGSGRRFVQSATRGMLSVTRDGVETMVPNYLIRVSDDDGETFQEYPFPAPEEGSFYLAAVDTSNPDRMLAYVDRFADAMPTPHADLILVSRDGGQSFEPYLEDAVLEFSGAAFLPDGRVFIGDRGSLGSDIKGLWSASSLDEVPVALQTTQAIGCLAYQSATDTLFGCGLRELGTIDPATGALTSMMKFSDVQSLAQCEGEDTVGACQVQLCLDYCRYDHFPETPLCEVYQSPTCGPCSATPPKPLCHATPSEAGAGAEQTDAAVSTASDASVSGAADEPRAPHGNSSGGCGCTVRSAARHGAGVGVALLLCGIALVRSARRSFPERVSQI